MLKRLWFRAAIPFVLLIFAIWLGDYLSTASSQKLIGMPPPKALVTAVDKLQEVLFWLVIAAVISVFVLDHMFEEVLNPTLEKAVASLRSSLESGLSGIREVMRSQMELAGHELTAVFKARLSEDTKKTIIEGIKDPEARDAAQRGNYELAKSYLEKVAKKDAASHEQWIEALILTENREEWGRAWTELKAVGYLRPHLSLAFRYWSVGETDTAIDVARTGLTKTAGVTNGKDIKLLLAKFKNSLGACRRNPSGSFWPLFDPAQMVDRVEIVDPEPIVRVDFSCAIANSNSPTGS